MSAPDHAHVLILEDDRSERQAVQLVLEDANFEVTAVENAAQASEHLQNGISAILTDYRLAGVDGLDFLRMARERAPHIPVIVLTGQGDEETAVAAWKLGAFHYLTKPVKPQELIQALTEACEQSAIARRIAKLQEEVTEEQGRYGLVGTSPVMRQVYETISKVADAQSTVLIQGDSGTGKELVARALHEGSRRSGGPFIAVNCAAIPASLIESELFGHVKGAFTGAAESRRGKFEAATGGTLLIDEIGEMPYEMQSKLLRAIETGSITPLGSNKELDCDVRLLASTHRDLPAMIRNNEFREDLFYRLNVVNIQLPPLRDRQSDIPLLTQVFVKMICEENNRPLKTISPESMLRLQRYEWPGNVRQLRNVLEGMIIMTPEDHIDIEHLPEPVRETSGAASLESVISACMPLAAIEREVICRTLERTGGNRTETSKILGVSSRTLQRRIKEYDLPY